MKRMLASMLCLGVAGLTLAAGPARRGTPATSSAPPARLSAAELTALHGQIVEKYMAGDWDALEAELAQKTAESRTMTAAQQADVTYIRAALAECHPAWWKTAKQGNKTLIRATIWGRNVPFTYETGPQSILNFTTTTAGSTTIDLKWPAEAMDSGDQAEHGFTKGELMSPGVWSLVELANIWTTLSAARLARLEGDERTKFARFCGFRGAVAGAYYGTPRGRSWMCFLSLDAYLGSHLTNEAFIPRKPFGAMLVAEIVGNPQKYPTLRLPGNRDGAADLEQRLATNLMRQFEEKKLTFAEDKALRELVKAFAMANGMIVNTSGKVTLPNKFVMSLDPAQDLEGTAQRNAWLAEEIRTPGSMTRAAATTGTATTGSAATAPVRGR